MSVPAELFDEGQKEYPWRLTHDQLLAVVSQEMSNAAGYDSADDEDDQALKYFAGELPAVDPDISGAKFRSKIVSRDFQNAVESTLAEIMPSVGSESPCEFIAVGEDDEAQVELETAAVNHVVMQVCGGYHAFNTAIKDGLIRRLPLIKVYQDEHAAVEYDEMPAFPLEQIDSILDEEGKPIPSEPGEEAALLEYRENDDNTVKVTIRRTRKKRGPRIVPVSKDEFAINDDHSSFEYDEARFLAHFRPRPVADLVAEGYDPELLRQAPSYGQSFMGSSNLRRRRTVDYESADDSTRMVLFHEIYLLVDMDGDDLAERIRVAAVGNPGSLTLLDWGFVNDQPFVSGYLYLGLYDWQGDGLFNRLKDIQGTHTELIRQILDFGERTLTDRVGIHPDDWDMDSVLESVMGGVALKTNRAATMDSINTPKLPRASEVLLGMIQTMRREAGGAAIDTSTQAMQVAQDSAHGTERVMSAMELLNAMLARNIAESLIKGVYKKTHRLLRKYWPGPLAIKFRGAWKTTVPGTQWSPREDVAIRAGLSQSERMRKAQALGFTIQQQQALLPLGLDGVLVSPEGMHEAQLDFLRLSGIARPGQYWVDPASEAGQQAAQGKQQAAQQQQDMQMKQLQAQLSVPIEMERVKGEYSLQREQVSQMMAQQREQAKLMNDMMQHLDKMRIELAKLNAEFDAEPVPDSLGEMR